MDKAWETEFSVYEIRWSRPMDLNAYLASPHPWNEKAFFYCVTGRYNQQRKILYIGKVFAQDIRTRLKQPDHLRKWGKLRNKYPKHHLDISIGILTKKTQSKTTNGLILNIERLLIWCHDNDHMVNKQSTVGIQFRGQAEVINTGHFKPFYRKCIWGAFVE